MNQSPSLWSVAMVTSLAAVLAVGPGCASDQLDPATTDAGQPGDGGSGGFGDVMISERDAAADTADTSTNDAEDITSDNVADADADLSDASDDVSTPSCAEGLVCVAAPDGWDGPFAITNGPYPGADGPPDGCDTEWQRYYRDPAGAPTCSECSCQIEAGQCDPPELRCEYGSACGGRIDLADMVAASQCYELEPDASGELSCTATSSAYEGSCTTEGGEHEAPAWGESVELCLLPQDIDRCAGACLAEDAPTYCIAKNGEATCPDGWTAESTAYAGMNDTRACSACGCDTSNVRCGRERPYAFGVIADCFSLGGVSPSIIIDEPCQTFELSGTASVWTIDYYPGTSGRCEAGDSNASGQVTPQEAVTICCQ